MSTYAPFAKPLYVMLKPVGAVCNLACDYCYYLEKSKLYVNNPKHVMSDELLEKFIEEYINSQTMPQVLFTWHGGETLMRPLAFYKKAMELQKKYANGRTIDNCIQTNGTLLTDEWCEFFKENNWLVGVSIDGPQEFHDEYRKNKQGKPSFVKVMQGINLLKKHGVEWNGMAVVNDYNADYPLEFYNFFKEIGCHYIQFAPIVERVFGHQDGRHLASLADREEVAELAKRYDKRYIVDAMSSFGGIPIDIRKLGIDFLVSSANKCIQGVPGFGFVIARRSFLSRCEGVSRSLSLDLYDQWAEMEKGHGKWRFTSPTHVVRAFFQAVKELEDEGGVEARHDRYRENHAALVEGMRRSGFRTLLPDELQSPIITSFLYPEEDFDFQKFYEALKERGFVIYPGKISEAPTFRIGNIGDVFPDDFRRLAEAVADIRRNK